MYHFVAHELEDELRRKVKFLKHLMRCRTNGELFEKIMYKKLDEVERRLNR